jgi:hypothetical protein
LLSLAITDGEVIQWLGERGFGISLHGGAIVFEKEGAVAISISTVVT